MSTPRGRGHVHPVVAVVRAALEKGEEVLWLTGAESCSALEREGFRNSNLAMGSRIASLK